MQPPVTPGFHLAYFCGGGGGGGSGLLGFQLVLRS